MARKHNARTTSGGFDGAAAPARARKPARSKRTEVEVGTDVQVAATAAAPVSTCEEPFDERAVIAQIAYSYYEARGCQGGSPEEDWLRAEAEYRTRG